MEEIDSIKDFENINITEVCRACFKTCKQYKVLVDEAENTDKQTLGDVFVDVVKIDIKTDAKTKPNRLCLTCCYDLTSAYHFIQKSQKNNELLVQYLKYASIKKHDCLHEIPIDVPIDQSVPDFLQIKVEDETISDCTDSMPVEFRNSPENSFDSDGSDYQPTANKKLKIEKLKCAYCTQLIESKHCENHMRTMHPEECQIEKEEESECNVLECELCEFCSTSELEMKKHENAEHKTRQQLNSKQLKARLKSDTYEFKTKLILEVQKHCCVYAKNSPDYLNRICRDKAWEDIALVLRKSVSECQKNWNNLRDSFRTIFKEDYCKSSWPGRNFKPKWVYFESLKFLIPHIKIVGDDCGNPQVSTELRDELHGHQVSSGKLIQTIGQSEKMKLDRVSNAFEQIKGPQTTSKKSMELFFQGIAKQVEHFSAKKQVELQTKILLLLATEFAEDLK